MSRFYYGPGNLDEALKSVAGMPKAQYEILKEAVTGPEGFSRTLERCGELAHELGQDFNTAKVFSLLASLGFLYDQLRDWQKTEQESPEALDRFLEYTGLRGILGEKDGQSGYQRLLTLIAKNSEIEHRRKLRWLRTGMLPTAINFGSFLDLRPNFSVDRSKFDELVPIIIMRVITATDYGEEKDHVFQLNLGSLAKLRKALDDIEKKLVTLREDQMISPRLLTDVAAPSDEEDES